MSDELQKLMDTAEAFTKAEDQLDRITRNGKRRLNQRFKSKKYTNRQLDEYATVLLKERNDEHQKVREAHHALLDAARRWAKL